MSLCSVIPSVSIVNELKQFLVDNWQILGASCLAIISFLFNLFRKRVKVDSLDGYLSYLNLFLIPQLIKQAEKEFVAGSNKKQFVCERVMKLVKSKFIHVTQDDLREVYTKVSDMIETYLSTPQKKG